MILKMINAVRGCVRVEISGAYIERFLNICAANRIAFWDIVRVSENTVRATVHISGFRMLSRYSRRAMCRVHIIKKIGLPFFTYKFRARYALFAGFAACFAAIWFLCGYIWTVDITGCEKISQTEIMECLKQSGFYVGMRAKEVNSDELRMKAMTQMKELLWLNINVNGSHAEIQITEREEAPIMADADKPCSIVARRDGVIVDMRAKNGVAIAETGQTVMAGDLLISGQHVSELTGTLSMRSMGNVYARTWYSLAAVIPAPSGISLRSGQSRERFSVTFGRKRINLFFNTGNPYDNCDRIISVKNVYAGDNVRLPAAVWRENFYDKQYIRESDYDSRAGEVLEEALMNRLESMLNDGEILSSEFHVEQLDGFYRGVLEAECVEDIAKELETDGASPVLDGRD